MTNSTLVAEDLRLHSAFREASILPRPTQNIPRSETTVLSANSHLQTYKYPWGRPHAQYLEDAGTQQSSAHEAKESKTTHGAFCPSSTTHLSAQFVKQSVTLKPYGVRDQTPGTLVF